MKTHSPMSFLLLVVGTTLMAAFGSEIAQSIFPATSWARSLTLPGYSVGLLMVSGAMMYRLDSRLKKLQSKIDELEGKNK